MTLTGRVRYAVAGSAFIPASNESGGCLKPIFGWFGHIDDCREGQIPCSLLRFNFDVP